MPCQILQHPKKSPGFAPQDTVKMHYMKNINWTSFVSKIKVRNIFKKIIFKYWWHNLKYIKSFFYVSFIITTISTITKITLLFIKLSIGPTLLVKFVNTTTPLVTESLNFGIILQCQLDINLDSTYWENIW